MHPALFDYLLRLGGSSLILGQRLSEWCGHGPVLEEDLALTNIALDLIGQSRLLLSLAGKLEGKGRDEDELAFLRNEGGYRNLTLVELPNGDFARTVVRNFLFSAFQCELWQALRASAQPELAAIAEKSAKEARYHFQHSADWVVRLGDGTDESHRRAQTALAALWPYTAEMFSPDPVEDELAAASATVTGATLQTGWNARVEPVIAEATLALPASTPFRSLGKLGVHTEHLGHLLAEMQHVQRAYPGARW